MGVTSSAVSIFFAICHVPVMHAQPQGGSRLSDDVGGLAFCRAMYFLGIPMLRTKTYCSRWTRLLRDI